MNAHTANNQMRAPHDLKLTHLAIDQLTEVIPELVGLLEEPRIADVHAHTIYAWFNDIARGDFGAVAVDRIEAALNALCIAHLCMFSYARTGGPGMCMTDLGGALAMRRARDAVAALTVGFHGEAGCDVVLRARHADEQRIRDIGKSIGVSRW